MVDLEIMESLDISDTRTETEVMKEETLVTVEDSVMKGVLQITGIRTGEEVNTVAVEGKEKIGNMAIIRMILKIAFPIKIIE